MIRNQSVSRARRNKKRIPRYKKSFPKQKAASNGMILLTLKEFWVWMNE
jgi:hypothetical protein